MASLLALDLGTTLGWAAETEKGIFSDTVALKSKQIESHSYRFIAFENFLASIFQSHNGFSLVIFEEVKAHKGVFASHCYGGFLATLTSFLDRRKTPYKGFSVGSIKKFICGKGNASKEEVIESLKSKGHSPKDDNEADALALLLLYKSLCQNCI